MAGTFCGGEDCSGSYTVDRVGGPSACVWVGIGGEEGCDATIWCEDGWWMLEVEQGGLGCWWRKAITGPDDCPTGVYQKVACVCSPADATVTVTCCPEECSECPEWLHATLPDMSGGDPDECQGGLWVWRNFNLAFCVWENMTLPDNCFTTSGIYCINGWWILPVDTAGIYSYRKPAMGPGDCPPGAYERYSYEVHVPGWGITVAEGDGS